MEIALTPDPDQIRLHLEVLFAELAPDASYPDGLFELRFLPPNSGRPICKLFSWGNLDAAIEMAVHGQCSRQERLCRGTPPQTGHNWLRSGL